MDDVLNTINHTTMEGLGWKNVRVNLLGVDITDHFVNGEVTVRIDANGEPTTSINGEVAIGITLDDLKEMSKREKNKGYSNNSPV